MNSTTKVGNEKEGRKKEKEERREKKRNKKQGIKEKEEKGLLTFFAESPLNGMEASE